MEGIFSFLLLLLGTLLLFVVLVWVLAKLGGDGVGGGDGWRGVGRRGRMMFY